MTEFQVSSAFCVSIASHMENLEEQKETNVSFLYKVGDFRALQVSPFFHALLEFG